MAQPSEQALEASLTAAAETHHNYEQEFLAGVRDEQWPGFYAAFALGALGPFTTPSKLASWLQDAPSSAAWAASAASYVRQQLASLTH